jgi:hypothetical protein
MTRVDLTPAAALLSCIRDDHKMEIITCEHNCNTELEITSTLEEKDFQKDLNETDVTQ